LQVPSRAATLAEQEGTNREIADLQQQSADLDALLEQRKQQFAGVSECDSAFSAAGLWEWALKCAALLLLLLLLLLLVLLKCCCLRHVGSTLVL